MSATDLVLHCQIPPAARLFSQVSASREENPELRIDLQLTHEVVDIVGRGIDIAVRVAPLRDSSLIARKIVDNPRTACTSPAYISKYGVPDTFSELNLHNCLRFTNVLQWTFEVSGQTTGLSVDGRFTSGNVKGVRELCIKGLGLAQLTLWDVKKEIAKGTLQEVIFKDAAPQNLPEWALLPTSRHVNVFIDALKGAVWISRIIVR